MIIEIFYYIFVVFEYLRKEINKNLDVLNIIYKFDLIYVWKFFYNYLKCRYFLKIIFLVI